MTDDMSDIGDVVRSYLEDSLGLSLDCFPANGTEVREFPERDTSVPQLGSVQKNRMLIVRIGSRSLALGTRSVVAVIAPVIDTMHRWELFSPLGVAELDRALRPEGFEALGGSLHYTLSKESYHPPQRQTEMPKQLLDTDAPPAKDGFDGEYVDAFGIEKDGKIVAVSQIRWKTPKFIEIAVRTDEEHRRRRYGLSVVAAATEWILAKGAMAHYPVNPENLASCRIPRRLGYSIGWYEIFGRQLSQRAMLASRVDQVSDRDIQRTMRHVEQNTLMVGLRNCPKETREKILGNMSERVRRSITDEMQRSSPTLTEIEEARRVMLAALAAVQGSDPA